jgi:hypothetical protein
MLFPTGWARRPLRPPPHSDPISLRVHALPHLSVCYRHFLTNLTTTRSRSEKKQNKPRKKENKENEKRKKASYLITVTSNFSGTPQSFSRPVNSSIFSSLLWFAWSIFLSLFFIYINLDNPPKMKTKNIRKLGRQEVKHNRDNLKLFHIC